MKTGRVTGNVYERSIHKNLNMHWKKAVASAASGEDCAFLPHCGGGFSAGLSQTILPYAAKGCGKYAVHAAVNQAAAHMKDVSAVLLTVLLPREACEQELKTIVNDSCEAARAAGVTVADVTASVTALVKRPVAAASAVGDSPYRKEKPVPGSRVVMTKWAGLEGTAILADRCRERLLNRYPAYLVEEAAGFDRFLSVIPEAAAAGKSGVGAMCAAAEGGIFGALWTLSQRAGVGLEIGLKRIPIRQETVEICNLLDLNPYELTANGSLLFFAENGELLVSELERQGIPAAVIGAVTQGNDRVIVNGEERRFLEPAIPDEIYKIMEQ